MSELKSFARRARETILRKFGKQLLALPVRAQDKYRIQNDGPIVVAGLMRTASGIGEAARACSGAFEALGINHTCVDLSPTFGQVDMPEIGALGPMPTSKTGTLILHLNAPETTAGLAALGLTRCRKWRIVGHWVWELEAAPASWAGATRYLSEIWTPSAYSAKALAPLTDLPIYVVPHRVVPQPQPSSSIREAFGLNGKQHIVLAMMDGRSSFARKNLSGTLAAFTEALGDQPDWHLVLKTRNFSEVSDPEATSQLEKIRADPKITLIDNSLTRTQLTDLMHTCDIFLSLHRAEGFGLTMAEAMAAGKPVIATGWSANTEFMDDMSSVLIPATTVPVNDPSGLYGGGKGLQWAEPDHNEAVTALRYFAKSPDARVQLGNRAREAIITRLGAAAYLKALNSESRD